MEFYLIFGPPAVGKMAVGRELQKLTGLKLFHNHMTIELLINFFEFESPEFGRLNNQFRKMIFQEVAQSELSGLIFTYVWALDHESDKLYVDTMVNIFKKENYSIYMVELEADLSVRLERNKGEERLQEKPSKRNVIRSEKNLLKFEEQYQLNSEGTFRYLEEFPNYLKVNTNDLSAKETAEKILSSFKS
ncbi:MAG: AAA family ATPase [Candidatus Kariarchaeaceae archaeon]